MRTIDSFTGKYAFLASYYAHPVLYNGEVYPTNEHAFQAAKTLDAAERKRICMAPSAHLAKQLGQGVSLRIDWTQVRRQVMADLVKIKFSEDPLRSLLLSTGRAELIEGNTWGDRTWGCTRDPNGRWGGANELGKILMEVRADLAAG